VSPFSLLGPYPLFAFFFMPIIVMLAWTIWTAGKTNEISTFLWSVFGLAIVIVFGGWAPVLAWVVVSAGLGIAIVWVSELFGASREAWEWILVVAGAGWLMIGTLFFWRLLSKHVKEADWLNW
jgi:hypothetical protein